MKSNDDEKKNTIKRYGELLKGEAGRRVIIVIGALGVAILLLAKVLPKKTDESALKNANESVTAEEYTERLEERLREVLGRVEGVGKCEVMVTLENGVEYVYASEEKSDNDYSNDGESSSKADKVESTVILVKTETGYEGLLVTELQPTVKGAVIVCEGGGDEAVCQRVTNAVTTVLNVTAKRVCVVAGVPNGMEN